VTATVSEIVAVEWDEGLVVVTVTPPATSETVLLDLNQDSLLSDLQVASEVKQSKSLNVIEAVPEELVIEPVAGEELEFEQAKGSQLIWLIGLGSLALLVTGLARRFSGK
jgi:hypothetical protein